MCCTTPQGHSCPHGKSERRALRERGCDRLRKRGAIRLVDASIKITHFEERIGRPAEMRLEVRVGDEPAARGADPAKSHAAHAEDHFERVLGAPQKRVRAPFTVHRRAQVRRLGTHTIVANCIHVVLLLVSKPAGRGAFFTRLCKISAVLRECLAQPLPKVRGKGLHTGFFECSTQ
jgi:hypothetical protein